MGSRVRLNDGEPPVLVRVARDFHAGRVDAEEVRAVFAGAAIWAQRPERPGVLVTELADGLWWAAVFSTPERLAAFAGECAYFSTTGSDLLELLPEGVAVMVDPADEHRLPILDRAAPRETLAEADRLGRQAALGTAQA